MEEAFLCMQEAGLNLRSELASECEGHAVWHCGDVTNRSLHMHGGASSSGVDCSSPDSQRHARLSVPENQDACSGFAAPDEDGGLVRARSVEAEEREFADLCAELDSVCAELDEAQCGAERAGAQAFSGAPPPHGSFGDQALRHLQEEVKQLQRAVLAMASSRGQLASPCLSALSAKLRPSTADSSHHSESPGATSQVSDVSARTPRVSHGGRFSRPKTLRQHELEPQVAESLPGRWRVHREPVYSFTIVGPSGGAFAN